MKMWYIYTVEYYPAIKMNDTLPFVTTWMDLEGIMLSEIIQTKKDKYCMISLICGIQKKKKRTDWWLPEVVGEGWVKWVKGVKMYKFSVIK